MNFRNLFARLLIAALGLSGAGEALAARTTTYLHTDGLGSVVAATNEAGAVLWRKDYAPFGEQLETSTGGSERISYTGKQHDDVVGLTNFGARQYDPEIGRFLNIDPVGFVDNNTMSFNRYLYVNNNPYKYVDPDGEFLNFAAKFVLDVGMNLAINYMTTGSLGVGMALKDSAMGILNPAKTLAKAGKLAKLVAKVEKKSPCPLSCFVAGTTVLAENGYVPIESLEVGDKVWAHDPDSGVTALKPIVRTYENTRDSVWRLEIEKDGKRYLHEVTGTHPYYVMQNGVGSWIEVASLQTGMTLKVEGEGSARVLSVHDTGEVVTTFNLEVADIHTYYVSAAKVLVHNCNKKGFVDLASPQRRKHILDGDATGGGHRAGTGKPGKSEFPKGWSDDKVMHEISDVATDPKLKSKVQKGGRTVTEGMRDGVNIRVIQEKGGAIVSGYPTNLPRNP